MLSLKINNNDIKTTMLKYCCNKQIEVDGVSLSTPQIKLLKDFLGTPDINRDVYRIKFKNENHNCSDCNLVNNNELHSELKIMGLKLFYVEMENDETTIIIGRY